MEMRAANKVLHLPGAPLSAAAASSLREVGMIPFRSASAQCAAALARTAWSGKILWRQLWDDMVHSADEHLPMMRN
eukprot:6046572-Heterocapsa_arctica.AAC.1